MNLRVVYTLIVLLGTTSCSSIKVYVENPEAASAWGGAYAFVPIQEGALDQASQILYDEIRQRIRREMEERNYTVDTEKPDMLIAFNILTEEQRREVTKSADPYGGYGRMWPYAYPGGRWPAMDRYRYKEIRIEKTGTLVMDVVSGDGQKLLWRGVGIGPVNDPEERFETAYKTVSKLFKKFPKALPSTAQEASSSL